MFHKKRTQLSGCVLFHLAGIWLIFAALFGRCGICCILLLFRQGGKLRGGLVKCRLSIGQFLGGFGIRRVRLLLLQSSQFGSRRIVGGFGVLNFLRHLCLCRHLIGDAVLKQCGLFGQCLLIAVRIGQAQALAIVAAIDDN